MKCPSQINLNRLLLPKKKGINSVKDKATSPEVVDVDESVTEVIGQDNFDLTYGEYRTLLKLQSKEEEPIQQLMDRQQRRSRKNLRE